jgi:Ran GTPase-activating protein (RanGAP) involved in mRNA processing and transport
MLLLFTGSKSKSNKKFEGLIKNKSLQVLDLSDNELADQHGELIIEFLRVQAESRDLKIWELGLRQNQAQLYLKRMVRSLNMQDVSKRRGTSRDLDS